MANERVSQLLELYAGDLASEDLFLITDMSQRESKKLGVGQLLLFIENSGSFQATTAASADTASFVLGSNVYGSVSSASYAYKSSYSDSASYATTAQNANQSTSASYASVAQAIVGGIGTIVSSSHATRTDYADNAGNAAYLYYSGVDNGTAIRAVTASYSDWFYIWYAGGTPSSNGHGLTIYEAVNDGVSFFMSGTVDDGKAVMQTFDNGTEPFLWRTYNYTGTPQYIVDRMWLTMGNTSPGSAKLTVFGDVSASAYTASRASGTGFLGTASFAVSASSVVSSSFAVSASYVASVAAYPGPYWIWPTILTSSVNAAFTWTTFNLAGYVPVGTNNVILDYYVEHANTNTAGWIQCRDSLGAPELMLGGFKSGGGGDSIANAGQGVFHITAGRTIQIQSTQRADGGVTIRIVGYY